MTKKFFSFYALGALVLAMLGCAEPEPAALPKDLAAENIIPKPASMTATELPWPLAT